MDKMDKMDCMIWGAGKCGKMVKKAIDRDGRYHVRCFVDRNPEKTGTILDGVPVLDASGIEKQIKKTDLVLIAMQNARERRKIIDRLIEAGIENIGATRKLFDLDKEITLNPDNGTWGAIVWNQNGLFYKPVFTSLEANIEDDCNLNCKGCSHFAQLFPGESVYPLDIFRRDMERIAKKAFVWQFNMLGGEVFLNRRLSDYMDFLRDRMPQTSIVLISNGLLIPSQKKEIFECIRRNHIGVSITAYRPTLKLEKEIREKLESFDIDYEFRRQVDDFGKNIDLSGKNDGYEAQRRCREYNCQVVKDGKIYKCPFQALGMHFFNRFEIKEISLGEGTDIFKENLNWKQMITDLYEQPAEACRYCGPEERFPWKTESHPAKEQWLISQE